MNDARQPALRQWLLLAGGVLLLNVMLTFANVWPTLFVVPRPELSVELGLLLLALAAYGATGRRIGAGMRAAFTLLLLAMTLGRYAEVTSPALYGRPVNLYWDAQHLPKVAAMLGKMVPWWLAAAGAFALAALLAALVLLLSFGVLQVARAVERPLQRRVLGAAGGAVVALYAASLTLDWPARHWYALPVSVTYGQQAEFLVSAYLADRRHELKAEPLEGTDLRRVAGADVVLQFLESYGAITYDQPEIAAVVSPARADLERAAAETGRRVVSALVESPTFGGGSWLAHATVMSGIDVRDPLVYELLLTQRRESLPSLFGKAGYRSIAVMPGLKNPWPEGAFYRFAKIYGERDLGYAGPSFGWWRIPDQFSLAKIAALELTDVSRPPLFAFFPTINTHIPFRPTPPYQADWARVLGPEPFDAGAVAASLAELPDWTHLGAPFAESFAYTFTYLAGFLRAHADLDVVLVLVGDHQPAASVTGVDARWDVPVHVVTSRGDVADALRSFGFIEGTALGAEPTLATMPALTDMLLRAFDSAGGAPAYGSGAAIYGGVAAP